MTSGYPLFRLEYWSFQSAVLKVVDEDQKSEAALWSLYLINFRLIYEQADFDAVKSYNHAI